MRRPRRYKPKHAAPRTGINCLLPAMLSMLLAASIILTLACVVTVSLPTTKAFEDLDAISHAAPTHPSPSVKYMSMATVSPEQPDIIIEPPAVRQTMRDETEPEEDIELELPVETNTENDIHAISPDVQPVSMDTDKYPVRSDIINIAENGWRGCSLKPEYQVAIQKAAEDNNVPYALALALCQHESGFDESKVSPTNDYGLFQVNACNLDSMSRQGIDFVNDPYDNITAGMQIFGRYYAQQDGDAVLALMCYNRGATGASQLWAKGVYSLPYTDEIVANYEYWADLLSRPETD